jgi:hypothetical protein
VRANCPYFSQKYRGNPVSQSRPPTTPARQVGHISTSGPPWWGGRYCRHHHRSLLAARRRPARRPASTAGNNTARPILRIPCMRRKNCSAHFALSRRRLKVAVVSSFRGTSWKVAVVSVLSGHLAVMMGPPGGPGGAVVGYPSSDRLEAGRRRHQARLRGRELGRRRQRR